MTPRTVLVSASSICKTYHTEDAEVPVLNNVDFQIEKDEFTVVTGPSGSGKTTLLNIISGIDKPTSGRIVVFGEDLNTKNEDFLADFRCKNIGFVFQSYNLVSTLTVAENIAFPIEWVRRPPEEIEKRVRDLLEMVALKHRTEHFPFQLSGGEQQRVAFARALANDPPLLLADEPTGNLDNKTSMKIIELLSRLKQNEKTLIVVTHNEYICELADRKLHLDEGKLEQIDD